MQQLQSTCGAGLWWGCEIECGHEHQGRDSVRVNAVMSTKGKTPSDLMHWARITVCSLAAPQLAVLTAFRRMHGQCTSHYGKSTHQNRDLTDAQAQAAASALETRTLERGFVFFRRQRRVGASDSSGVLLSSCLMNSDERLER